MSRVFVVGAGPMQDGTARRVTAHAVRTWHFVTTLRRAGHEVVLCTVSQNISDLDPKERLVEKRSKDGFAYENLDMRMGDMLAYLRKKCTEVRPDCVVGVSTEPASWACRMRPTVPVWADLHGWVMAEAQLKAARDGNDDILYYFWRHERPVLRRADKISTVSNAQRFAVLGELATVGRLNRYNAEYELVLTLPGSVDPALQPEPGDSGKVARLVGSDKAFVVIWSGGFNTWSDPETLFAALEWAMEREPAVHFVATGGSIPGHADSVFNSFAYRVEQSPHKLRYHLVGWVPADRFPSYLAGADLAICVDFPCVETSIGTRTRLIEAMSYGVPVLMTRGTELSMEIEDAAVGWVVEPRNPQALGRKVVECARDREATVQMGRAARDFVRRRLSIERTMEPVVRWVEKPQFAPDNACKHAISSTISGAALNRLEANARALDEVEDVEALAQARRELERLRSRWPLRLWRRVREILRGA